MIKALILSTFLIFISTKTWAKDPFFIGTWEYQSCDSEKIMCGVQDISFSNNTVSVDAYPPLRHRCDYKVKEINEKMATLTLLNHKGDLGQWKTQMIIEKILSSPDLTIDGKGPYVQTHPVKDTHKETGEK